MVNKIILQGRLTRDVEVQQTSSGIAVCKFSIATDRKVAKGAEKKADFIECEAWRNTAEFVGKYFHKGSEMLVVGAIQSDSYETRDGQKRIKTYVNVEEVNFCGSKSAESKPTEKEPNFVDLKDTEDLPF